jgi:hypothetical protein
LNLKIKNIILLVITGLCLVFIIIPILLPSQGGEKISPAMFLPPLPPQKRTAGEEGVIPHSPAARPFSADVSWGRDPFSLPSGIRPTGETTGRESLPGEAAQETRLTAILRRGNKTLATINHRVVQEGDLIQGEKVIQIGKDSVTLLARDGSKKTLKLYENLPSVMVTNRKEGEL